MLAEASLLNVAQSEVNIQYRYGASFKPRSVVIVTWEGDDDGNVFQLALLVGDKKTFAHFVYSRLRSNRDAIVSRPTSSLSSPCLHFSFPVQSPCLFLFVSRMRRRRRRMRRRSAGGLLLGRQHELVSSRLGHPRRPPSSREVRHRHPRRVALPSGSSGASLPSPLGIFSDSFVWRGLQRLGVHRELLLFSMGQRLSAAMSLRGRKCVRPRDGRVPRRGVQSGLDWGARVRRGRGRVRGRGGVSRGAARLRQHSRRLPLSLLRIRHCHRTLQRQGEFLREE